MKSKLIAVAVCSALGLTTLPAHAGLIGQADLSLSTFVLRNLTAGGFVTDADISIIDGTRQSSSNATMSGFTNVSNETGLLGAVVNADAPASMITTSAAGLNALYGGNLQNNTTTFVGAPSATFNYALGDSFVSGNALAGGAAGLTRADTSIMGPTASATANGNVQNSISAASTFTANSSILVDFFAVYSIFVKSYIDPIHFGVPGSSTATAGVQFTLNVFDETAGSTLLNWTPDQLNRNFSTSTSNNGTNKEFSAFNALLDSPDALLTAGHSYQMTITQNSTSSVRSVPEPVSLALVGLGLFGAGIMRRRKI